MKYENNSFVKKAIAGDLLAIGLALRIFSNPQRRYYDPALAKKLWLTLKSLSKMNPEAMCFLGEMYLYGSPYGRIPPKGIALIELAAKNESTNAIINIATWYMFGLCGYPKDSTRALQMIENDNSERATSMRKLFLEYSEAPIHRTHK
ncbi:MAG: hypothetical protein ABTQ25_16630 [Nitrosomonas ureae]